MLESYLPLYRPESRLPTLYINPNIDALFINEYIHKLDKVIPEFSPRILRSLRHLVVESERVLRHPSYSNASMIRLTKFANLEKLTMSTPPTKPDFRDVVLLSIFPYPLSAHLGGGCELAEYYNAMRFQLSEEAVSNIRAWSSPDVAQGYSWVSAAIEKVSRDNPDWKVPRIDLKAVERIRKLTGTDGDWASMLDEGLSIGEFELALS
ncbi:hypothetical protein MBM_01212 [Drepanopeziza brunnea f. sp. 'multigermtubi' MB_m1]|uniref:Uncharacterized protein n=1 Tax=Marssonina brunnea f. sp. multigermtubi (strain MB_m1) TaxID=1072389 RepID=K1WSD4_MARBU|nr:uncharacterized protein MBM_01212 [Drepanopeziza brunnea f. sp. 'multigermtubi' MB_m1]EKD20530.1 hypothetical protein MBM_01212 [Drepanopeziza brunnea f. sp. 'multigermtubi' MB_m1]